MELSKAAARHAGMNEKASSLNEKQSIASIPNEKKANQAGSSVSKKGQSWLDNEMLTHPNRVMIRIVYQMHQVKKKKIAWWSKDTNAILLA